MIRLKKNSYEYRYHIGVDESSIRLLIYIYAPHHNTGTCGKKKQQSKVLRLASKAPCPVRVVRANKASERYCQASQRSDRVLARTNTRMYSHETDKNDRHTQAREGSRVTVFPLLGYTCSGQVLTLRNYRRQSCSYSVYCRRPRLTAPEAQRRGWGCRGACT